ncbi:serine hydrolase [Parasphingorhabdus sp.]
METDIEAGKFGKIVSVTIEQHGDIIYSRNFDKENGNAPHDIRSAGKSLTALAVGIAIDEGKLESVDQKVWPLLGAPADDIRNDITIRDLLTMSSALDCNDGKKRSPGQEERMYRKKIWRTFALNLPLMDGYQRDEKGYGRWSYCTAGVFLLGQVIETVTGEKFDAFVQTRLFDPLAIKEIVWRTSKTGEIQSGGQIKMLGPDLAKIGRMVLDGGVWKESRIVSRTWIKQMLYPHRELSKFVHYGYLWWFTPIRAPQGFQSSWYMQGNGGNMVAVFRDYDAVIVVQAANYNKSHASRNAFTIVEASLSSLQRP